MSEVSLSTTNLPQKGILCWPPSSIIIIYIMVDHYYSFLPSPIPLPLTPYPLSFTLTPCCSQLRKISQIDESLPTWDESVVDVRQETALY